MLRTLSRDISLKDGQFLRIPPLVISRDKLIAIYGNRCKNVLVRHVYDQAKKSHCNVSYTSDEIVLHAGLTVRETLWFLVALCSEDKCDKIDHVLATLWLDTKTSCLVDTLSSCEKKRLMLAFMLLDNTADLLLMEDPFEGLDPEQTSQVVLLLEKKKKTSGTTIIFTAFSNMMEVNALDEMWVISAKLEVQVHDMDEQRLGFVDIELVDTPVERAHSTSFRKKLMYLFYRDRVIDKRNALSLFGKWIFPISIIFVESCLVGTFPRFLLQWTSHGNIIDLAFLVVVENIFLFTIAFLPLYMTHDHFRRRNAVLQEVDHGLYPKGAYLCSAITWDQLCMVMIATCLTLVSLFPDNMFAVSFLTITMQMLYTNMLIWFLSYFFSFSNHTTLSLVSAYVIISFVISQGFLLPRSELGFLQYTSMTHIQLNAFLQHILSLFPHMSPQLDTILSWLDVHEVQRSFSTKTWISIGVALWSILPISMALMTFFFP